MYVTINSILLWDLLFVIFLPKTSKYCGIYALSVILRIAISKVLLLSGAATKYSF